MSFHILYADIKNCLMGKRKNLRVLMHFTDELANERAVKSLQKLKQDW